MTPPESSVTFTSVEYDEGEASSSREEQPGRPGGLGGAHGW